MPARSRAISACATSAGSARRRRHHVRSSCSWKCSPPTFQGDDFHVQQLAGGEVDVSVLVGVPTEALWRDPIMPRRNVAIDGAAVFDSPNIAAVHVDQSKIEALGGF